MLLAHIELDRDCMVCDRRNGLTGKQIIGRYASFVECGPTTYFSRAIYQQCIWHLLEEDLASGWGYVRMASTARSGVNCLRQRVARKLTLGIHVRKQDLVWHKFCAARGFNSTVMYDQHTSRF